jgi:GAT domain
MADMIEQVERRAPASHISSSEVGFVEESYGGGLTEEEKKEALVLARNSIDLLSSIVNSPDFKQNPEQDNDLTTSILDKCRDTQPVIKKIIERTTDDEAMLFEAISLHDEIDVVLSKFREISMDCPPETDGSYVSNIPNSRHVGEENNLPEKKGDLTTPGATDRAAGSSENDLM